jgi:hypothetical protein
MCQKCHVTRLISAAMGHSQPSHSAQVPANVRYATESGKNQRIAICCDERALPVTGQVSESKRELSAIKGGPL